MSTDAKTASQPASGAPRWLNAGEQEAWRGLQRMQAALGAVLNRQLSADTGLSLQDYMVLVVLTAQPEGRMRPFELGRELGWEKSRLSHHVSRMAQRGLVSRERCLADQRGWYVAVSPEGWAAIEGAAPGHVEAVRRWFIDRLTPEQISAMASVADAVLAGLTGERGACNEAAGAGEGCEADG